MRQKIAENLANLDDESYQDFVELLEINHREESPDERKAIGETLIEILCPDILKQQVYADLTKTEEAIARRKLTAYREKVGEQIAKYRKIKKLSQVQLGELAGIPQSHVSRLERGQLTATFVTIEKIAKALKITPSRIDPGFDD